jgi:hypothetical protein
MKKLFLASFLTCISVIASAQFTGKWEAKAFVSSTDTTMMPADMMEYTFLENSVYLMTINNGEETKTQRGHFYYLKNGEFYNLTLVGENGTVTDEVKFISKEKLVWYAKDLQGSFLLTKEYE